jgi:chromatin structure-remodeling complex subunit SFH1
MINYADPPSGDEIDVDPDTDDSEFNNSKALGRISSFRAKGGSGYATPQGAGTPALGGPASGAQGTGKHDLDQSYLGMIPPSKFLLPKLATPTRHDFP